MTDSKSKFGIKVSVEAAIHRALMNFSTDIYKEHGIAVKCVDIEWIKEVGGDATAVSCKISTEYFGGCKSDESN